MKRLSLKSKFTCGVLAAILFVSVFQLLKINRSAQNKLANERARLLEQNRVVGEK